MRALIDRMAKEPQVRLDKPGDPRVGMTGGSYGGGIQLSTAGIDRRVDAIVPVVAWHSLETSLYKDRTAKQGWNSLLYGVGLTAATNGGLAGGPAGVQTGGLDPHITSAYNSQIATGVLSAEDEEWFRDRGPGRRDGPQDQGADAPGRRHGGHPLPARRGRRVYNLLRARGTPVKMFWFCGGHGQCAEGNGGVDGARTGRGARSWGAAAAIHGSRPPARPGCPLPEGRPQGGHRPRFRVPLGRRGSTAWPRSTRSPGQAGEGARLGKHVHRARCHLGYSHLRRPGHERRHQGAGDRSRRRASSSVPPRSRSGTGDTGRPPTRGSSPSS